MALNIGRGNLSAIQAAITAEQLKAGDIIITKDQGNELVLIERDGSQVVVGVGTVKNPSYDAETRTITLPVKQADGTTQDFVINLGKDNVVTSGVYNAETGDIELTLVSGDVIKVPATALVDVYTGDATNTVVVSVSEDNVITAQAKLSTVTGNLLKADENGLYVVEADFTATKQLIADEATARDAAIATAVGNEATARDAAIATAGGNEATARDAAIATAVGNEATARGTAIEEAIAAEVEARDAAIATAKGEAEATAKGYTDEKLGEEATARDAAIATAVGNEATARDAAIATAVGNEATARDAAIEAAIAAEVTARNAAIATAKGEANGYTDEQFEAAKEYTDEVAAQLGVKWVDFGA